MLLALDTATAQAGLALYDGDQIRALSLWQAGLRHSPHLAPAVEQALAQAGVAMAALSVVAATTGPGSFTGLRVGLSMAKGLAVALGLPLVGISTLDVVAYPHLEQGQAVVALVQAGRSRHAWARYEPDATRAAPQATPPMLASAAEIAEQLAETTTGPLLLAGDLTPTERERLRLVGPRLTLLPAALALRSPAALAALAWARHQAGHHDDAATLEPLYLHLPTSGTATPSR